MVNIILVCLCIVGLSQAAPQQYSPQDQQQQAEPHQDVQILKQESVVGVDGYHFEFETSDGTAREEQGELKDAGSDHAALSVKGSYRYVAPDGKHYSVTFLADEHGFQPSAHLDADSAASSQQDAAQPQA